MILLIDIGNSRTKWGFADRAELHQVGAVIHSELSSELSSELFSQCNIPDEVWISCVGPKQVLSEIQEFIKSHFHLTANIVSVTSSMCGLSNAYDDLEHLGVDRWVAAIGGRSLVPLGDIIVVDAGTAVTLDWISKENEFSGGAIFPGLSLMHDSLVGQTQGIRSDLMQTTQIIGKNTKECVNAGIAFGLIGAVERIIKKMQQQINASSTLIFTGGYAPFLLANSSMHDIHEPNLVLLGLMQIANDQQNPVGTK